MKYEVRGWRVWDHVKIVVEAENAEEAIDKAIKEYGITSNSDDDWQLEAYHFVSPLATREFHGERE